MHCCETEEKKLENYRLHIDLQNVLNDHQRYIQYFESYYRHVEGTKII